MLGVSVTRKFDYAFYQNSENICNKQIVSEFGTVEIVTLTHVASCSYFMLVY